MIKKIINQIIIFLFIFNIFCIDIKAIKPDGYYIYSETCLDCESIFDEITDFSKDKNIEFIILKNENMEYINSILDDYHIEKLKIPLLIYKDDIYSTSQLKEFLNNSDKSSKSSISLLFLGFIDGFNPCAISILMIFSSFLMTLDKKKQLLFIGLSFILGQSLSNFLLGFGLLSLTNFISNFSIFLKVIYILTILIGVYILFINTLDIINGFKNNKEIKNILSINIRYKINTILSKGITSKCLILTSFIIGFIIAILEFGCTGQIYFPSILYMSQLDISTIINLLLYNFMFSLPLLFFLLLALFINPSELQKNVIKYSFIIKIFVNIILLFLLSQIIFNLIK